MPDGVAAELNRMAGVRQIANFGVVHTGRVGRAACAVETGIECWSGCHFVRITSVLAEGPMSRHTNVVKWPYARKAPASLRTVIEDLDALTDAIGKGMLRDGRTVFGRFFDRMTGTRDLGAFEFASPLGAPYDVTVSARLSRFDGQTIAALTERRPGKGFIEAQLPHGAIPAIAAALRGYTPR